MLTAKQLAKATLVTTLAIIPTFAAIGFPIPMPTHDPINMAENIAKQLADIEERILTEIERAAKRKLKAELKGAVSETHAGTVATEQLAKMRLEENLRNHQVAIDNMPVSGICGAVSEGKSKLATLSFSMYEDFGCRETDLIRRQAQDEIIGITLPNINGITHDSVSSNNKLITNQHKETEDIPQDILYPHVKYGLNEREYQAAVNKLKIMMLNQEPVLKRDIGSDKKYLESVSKSMRSTLPYKIALDQVSDKIIPSELGYSLRQAQEGFAEDYWNTDSIESYTFKEMHTISQTKREHAILLAYLSYMAVERYKSSLDRELILATELLEAIPD